MALVKCIECGKMISDRAESCPQCGCPVSMQKPKIVCPECGTDVPNSDTKCPNCGCPSLMFDNSLSPNRPSPKENISNNNYNDGETHQISSEKDVVKDVPEKQTDIFAIICFAAACASLLFLPIVFIPVSCISGCVSYYRIKENPNLKGGGLRIVALILNIISVVWLISTWSKSFVYNYE